MKKSARKKHILAGGVAVAILVLLFGIMDQAGYVLSGPYIVKGGTLVIEEARPGSDVFIDNRRAGRINSEGSSSFGGIRPGERNVIVAHADAWPWILDFEGVSGQTTVLRPLQVYKEPEGISLTATAEASRDQADAALSQYREPTRIQPLKREDVRVWIEGATVFTQTGEELNQLFSSTNPIRSIFWYNDRSDAVIIASQDTVFALDLRAGQVQNFLPIYKGVAPEATADPNRPGKIFIKDNEEYLSVSI